MALSDLSVSSKLDYDTALENESRPDDSTTPEYGRRPLARVIDDVASKTPSRPFLFIPKSDEARDGWKPVSFKEISNAINYVAGSITEHRDLIPDLREPFATVAYIGPNDLRYFVFMMACVKMGLKALFISPRNTVEGQISLFKSTNCRVICFAPSYRTIIQPWLQQYEMQSIEVSDVTTWLECEAPPMPYLKTAEEVEWEPLAVLHSSGSTGIPKPIIIRQGSMQVADALHHLPDFQGSRCFPRVWADLSARIFLPLPLFHVAGLFILSMMCVYYGTPVALPPPGRPLTSDLMVECLTYAVVDTAIIAPALIEELSASEQGVEVLKRLKFLAFGGGNLSTSVGDKLAEQGVVIHNIISSTEYFPYILYLKLDPQTWQYFVFDSKAMGVEWRPVANGKELYEMVIVRKDPNKIGFQTIFYTFPDATEFPTRDIYRPHPTLPDHWLWCNRADDIIVFSNGEKLNPVTIESIVTGHPSVKAALVVGQERFQSALLLEPVIHPQGDEETTRFIDDVWPTIEKANEETVAHGRVSRRLVMLSHPEKPFSRAGKGTVQRGPTVKLYASEIDHLYDSADTDTSDSDAVDLDFESCSTLTQSIMRMFQTRIHSPPLEPETGFFDVGLDSLQVINASKLLRSGLKTAGRLTNTEFIAPKVIYQHPTPKELAAYLYSVVEGGLDAPDAARHDIATAEELLKKFSANLPAPRHGKIDPLDSNQTILLTGSTGSLGAYMLDFLIASPRVGKIIALNRGADGGLSRQPGVSSERGLSVDFSKVEFLQADLSQPYMGVGQDRYARLLDEADRIIHNAWPVNFNISMASFAPHIQGVRRLVDFSAAAAKRVPIIFVSSIGTVDKWMEPEPVPERALSDLSLPSLSYGRAKQVGSLILDAASEASDVPAVSVRVGQIAGPRSVKGMWNSQEFIPSLIASSVHLGILPANFSTNETVDWVPVENMARIILEVGGVTTNVPIAEISGYFHAVNPSVVSWSELASVIMEFYPGRIKKLVSMAEWVEALEASGGSTEDIDKNPAFKLLDVYRAMVAAEQAGAVLRRLDVAQTKRRSPTLRNLGPITPDLMKNWCTQWGYSSLCN